MADAEVTRFYQSVQERITAVATRLIFFSLELNRLPDAVLAEQMQHPGVARYRAWIDASRAQRPHQLADEMEQLLLEKQVAGRAAWVRLFDETIAALRVAYRDQSLTVAEVMNLLVDRDRGVRQDAAQSFGKALAGEGRVFSLITNTLAKDKEIEDRWRQFAAPVSARNLGNRVEDSVVSALVAAVRDSYASLSHRYYRLKAAWLGQEVLDYWDRNAPLPGASEKLIGWQEARGLVLDAFQGFSPALADVGRRFFENPWIDAAPRPGKDPGAFAHPTVPGAHPYLLVNYHGKVRDVMTLAHELGHGVHQVLAGQAQGHLLADTPLTLAETASVFGEMLTFRALLAAETDPLRRRTLLAGKVEDMLNTVVRQIAMHSFEEAVHAARRQGELTVDDLGDLWIRTQQESLGPSLRFDPHYRSYWSYIPHFIHAPFYVYAYAFGDCLVNSLYAVYQQAGDGFADRYLALLSAGGSRRYDDLLKPFGLDARDPGFWKQGLGVIAGFIDELERTQ
jgi:oligoendopeptidase F